MSIPSSTKVPPSGNAGNDPSAPPSGNGVTPAGGTLAGVSFKGLAFDTWGAGWPPDTTGDVGPNHYIQAVNTFIGIYSKTGTQLAAFTYNTFFSAALTGTLCDTSNSGDPLVVYDQMADRWIISDFAFAGAGTTPPFYECIAVSKTGDPINGGWWFYGIRTDDVAHPWLADYPKMGIWPDGLYMTANMFDATFVFREVRGWAFNRSDLYSGAAVRMVIVDLNTTTYFSLLPSNVRGTPPPAGRENLFISESRTVYAFEVFKFHVDYSGSGSMFTGPTNVSQALYTVAAGTVPSPGNSMDSVRERLMQWAQYRNIGGTESLWVSHTVRTGAPASAPAGIQWAQLNVTGGVIAVAPVQQQIYGNLGADGIHRWMGSLAVDKDGNMGLGYSASSATLEPDIRPPCDRSPGHLAAGRAVSYSGQRHAGTSARQLRPQHLHPLGRLQLHVDRPGRVHLLVHAGVLRDERPELADADCLVHPRNVHTPCSGACRRRQRCDPLRGQCGHYWVYVHGNPEW